MRFILTCFIALTAALPAVPRVATDATPRLAEHVAKLTRDSPWKLVASVLNS